MKAATGGEDAPDNSGDKKDAEGSVPERKVLPLMKTSNDAVALSEEEHDSFFLNAFAVQCWLGRLVVEVKAEYAEKKNPKDRSLQTCQAWRGFLTLFGDASDEEFPKLLSHLFRFAEYDDVLAEWLRGSLVPLSIEHDCFGEYFGPKTMEIAKRPKERAELARRSVARWCDWLEALIHFRTHEHWHLAPASFDPDPEKSELAALGTVQRHLANLSEPAKAWWQWHFAEAVERFKGSPKWPALGVAMAAEGDRLWPYREIDVLVISLWPLVKKHNWTYRDLLNVIRPALTRPTAYPCEREQDFATYCTNVLGLRKMTKGVSAKDGRPAGWEVAVRMLQARA
jgi:hypothetical protein